MKKQKYYLAAGVLACSAISGLAMPLANTFAEGDLDGGSHDAIVGEVDETEYSVNISWGNMTFDWKYNSATNSFDFQPQTRCVGSSAQYNLTFMHSYQNEGNLYSDNTCTALMTGELTEDGFYYYTVPDGEMTVKDFTQNGRIKATASFTPESKYDWVTGEFGGWSRACSVEPDYTECSTAFTESGSEFYFNSNIVESGVEGRLLLKSLNLKKAADPAYSDSITSSDKIGTVTITIEPDLN